MRAPIQPSMQRLPMFPPPPPAPPIPAAPTSFRQPGTNQGETFTRTSRRNIGQFMPQKGIQSVGEKPNLASLLQKPKTHLAYRQETDKKLRSSTHSKAKQALQTFMESDRSQQMAPARKKKLERLFGQLLQSLR